MPAAGRSAPLNLTLDAGASADELRDAMTGTILAEGSLTGLHGR